VNPLQLLRIFAARWKIATAVAVLTIGAGIAVNEFLPKRYVAETTMLVDVRAPDPVAAALIQAPTVPVSMATQAEVIGSIRTTRKVVNILKLDQSSAAREQWMAATEGKGKLEDWLGGLLQKSVKVVPSRDSGVLKIAYSGSDPVFVAAVANAFAQAYIEASIELKVEPARQHSRWFSDQGKVSRENVEKAQARLSDFQKQHSIVATEEAMDVETVKLNDLSARLNTVQGELRDAQTKQRTTNVAPETLPEVQASSTVSQLRADIAQREARLKDANLGTKHPQYLRMEGELAELRKSLDGEIRRITSGYSSSSTIHLNRQAELQAAIEAQKKKVLLLKANRDELAVLMRDVETAKRAYDAVSTRFNQTSLESQATQTNVSVLTPAFEPLAPSFPKPFPVMLALVSAVGVILGGLAAVGHEMLDRRVRSTADLAEMLQLPVLGVVAKPRRQSRLLFWRRSLALAVK